MIQTRVNMAGWVANFLSPFPFNHFALFKKALTASPPKLNGILKNKMKWALRRFVIQCEFGKLPKYLDIYQDTCRDQIGDLAPAVYSLDLLYFPVGEVSWWNSLPPFTGAVLFSVCKAWVKDSRVISCSGVNGATWLERAISLDAAGCSCVFDSCMYIYWMYRQWGTCWGHQNPFISLRTSYFTARSLEVLCSWVPAPVSA